jgi:3-dehydroquinate synthase
MKGLASELRKYKHVFVVCDRNVEDFARQVAGIPSGAKHGGMPLLAISADEEHKNIDTVMLICRWLLEQGADRDAMVLAVGGGVTTDMAGFAACIYKRGVRYANVPTTLLSMVDAGIGGKTGVDLGGIKNMVGAFYMPRLVYMNIAVLDTLPGRQFASGFAEVMKHGLIKDQEFYFWLIENLYEINERDHKVLAKMVRKSCEIKRDVVQKDPTEKGERALLNFGHTIGHAIEKARNFELYHGECVALGCIAAAYISMKKGLIETGTCYEIRDMFVPFNLPITVEDVDPEEIVKLVKSDKKMDNNCIKFILLKDIGDAFIDTTVTDDEIREAVKEILYFENGD